MPDLPDGAIASNWATVIAAATGIVGGVLGAAGGMVVGAWRVRGLLADLQQKDLESLHRIEELTHKMKEIEEQIAEDRATQALNHQENTNAIHRLSNAVQVLPTTERFNRLEDRMLDYLKEALQRTPPRAAE